MYDFDEVLSAAGRRLCSAVSPSSSSSSSSRAAAGGGEEMVHPLQVAYLGEQEANDER